MSVRPEDKEHIHGWFELTYAAYLVLPRSVLQSLPAHLQKQLVDALCAIESHLYPAHIPARGTYHVELRDEHGRFLADPLRAYERGRRRVTKDELVSLSRQGAEERST